MKRSKKNPDLAEALSHLRDWCVIERKLTDDPGEYKVWRDIADWAAGAAIKYRVELARPVSPPDDVPHHGQCDCWWCAPRKISQ
jgi:hypothetical protein